MDSILKKTLEAEGWTVECESPLEIHHEDGSFCTGGAALILLEHCRELIKDDEMIKSKQNNRIITFVMAPNISNAERLTLEAHWEEAILDYEYKVFVNYEVCVKVLEISEDSIFVLSAPNLPVTEIQSLRKRVDESDLIVTNYMVYPNVFKVKNV